MTTTVQKKSAIVKQSIGIDVSAKELSVAFQVREETGRMPYRGTNTFSNDLQGFKRLSAWIGKFYKSDTECMIVLEATGVYYENAVYYLSDNFSSLKISVVLPNKAKYFAKTLDNKSKTDKLDAKMLAQMGLEKNLPEWVKPSPEIRSLRGNTRERECLVDLKTILANQLHAHKSANDVDPKIIARIETQIDFFADQIKEVEADIKEKLSSNVEFKENTKILNSVLGFGLIVTACLIAETQNFANFKNQKQLVSYAGLDVVHRTSGTSIKGKTKISKKGNSHIRRVLYFAAVSHIRNKGIYRTFSDRITDKGSPNMVAITAVQRKLLVLALALVKKKSEYDKDYKWTQTPKKQKDSDSSTVINSNSDKKIDRDKVPA
jgi:transposase